MTGRPTHRGLTLIEAVAAVAILAIAVPPSVVMLTDAAQVRAGSASAERAMWLAGAALETVAADVASGRDDLGFDALADEASYLDDPATGLRARLGDVAAWAQSAGLTWEVTIGPLVGPAGAPTGDGAQDVFRSVTVEAAWPGARGEQTLTLSRMVADR